MLTAKQERFCQEYVIDLNGTQACIRAGYSPKTANEQSARLLANVSIKQRITQLQAEIAERNKLKADDVISELRLHAFWNIQDFIEEDNSITKLKALDRKKAIPIAGIKVKETFTKVGETTIREVTTELKLTDKRAALVDLGRHLGIFKEDNEQKAGPVLPMTDDQFETLRKEAREAAKHTSK